MRVTSGARDVSATRMQKHFVVRGLLGAWLFGAGCVDGAEPLEAGSAPAEIDEGLRVAALAQLQADAPARYDVHAEAGAWQAHNDHLDLAIRFDEAGVAIGEALALRTTSIGRSGATTALAGARPSGQRNRVSYDHGDVDEWYVNGPLGLEQGFTVAVRPDGDAELSVEIVISGARSVSLSDDGGCVDLEGAHGEALAYCELHALDADGEPLPSRMQLDGRRITLVVDDTEAHYPITIDPYLWVKQFELKPNDSEAGDWFGAAVAVDGDRAVVGAYLDDGPHDDSPSAGAAYGFQRTDHGWVATREYVQLDAPEQGAQCGRSVAISGEIVAVGCPGSDAVATDAGKVLVFDPSLEEITASDAAAGDDFGCSVALSGSTLVVGAQLDDVQGSSNAGSAYVFVRDDETHELFEQAKLVASDLAPGDFLGGSVAVSGNRAIVGAHLDDNPKGIDAGAAYVFHRSGSVWSQNAKLTGSLAGPSDWFGYSVDIDGARAIAGAPYDGASNGGAAYVFNYFLLWSQSARLVGSDTANNDNFGLAVAIDQGTAVVSARLDDWGTLTNAGSAYVFTEAGGVWSQQSKLTASNAASTDYLLAVAISGDVVFAGATRADVIGASSGTAYAFERSAGVWSASKTLSPAHGSHFGHAVGISGNTAVVGASATGYFRPGAYVYDRVDGVWQQSRTLALDEDLYHDTNMGQAVAIDGDTIAVGLPGDDMGGPFGRVEVFHRYLGIWHSQGRFPESGHVDHDGFGSAIAVLGDRLVAGAPNAVNAPPELASGAAYVYERSQGTWELAATLATSAPLCAFGSAVTMSADRIVVGAPQHVIDGEAQAGSAHVFALVRGQWELEAELFAPTPEFFDHYGASVAISGDTILVGSRGTVYVYELAGGSWSLEAELDVPGLVDEDFFGRSVALDGELAVIGAPSFDDEGSAYVFTRTGGVWTQSSTLVPTAGDAYSHYGATVALDGTTAIVGGHREATSGVGPANIYQRVYFPFPF